MLKIMYAMLTPTGTLDNEGAPCEWAWAESTEAEHGREWNGDAAAYVANLDLPEDVEIGGEYSGSVQNLPEGAVVLTRDGAPTTIYWAENPIKVLRERSRMTQAQVANELGIGWRHYAKIESGEQPIGKISFSVGTKLAEIFDVEPRELLECQ